MKHNYKDYSFKKNIKHYSASLNKHAFDNMGIMDSVAAGHNILVKNKCSCLEEERVQLALADKREMEAEGKTFDEEEYRKFLGGKRLSEIQNKYESTNEETLIRKRKLK